MITIKTPEEIKILNEGGKRLASVLRDVAGQTKSGIATIELEQRAKELIAKAGGQPSFLRYQPRGEKKKYPSALCVSINDEIVHGIPSAGRILKEGDIVSLDLGLEYKNLFTDSAVTVAVGKIDSEAKKLLQVTKKCLDVGMAELKQGSHVGDYGFAVRDFVEKSGFKVVKNLVGHGVGYAPHEDPDVPNYGKKGQGAELKIGMVLAIEPMVCQEEGDLMLDKDGWTWKTKNGLLSAHFEHTIVVEENGCRILTKI